MEPQELYSLLVGMQSGTGTLEDGLVTPFTTKHVLLYHPLQMSGELKATKEPHTWSFMAHVFIIVKHESNQNFPRQASK